MSSFANKMLKQQGYSLPSSVARKAPENPSDSLTVRFLKNAGFYGLEEVEEEDNKELDNVEEQPKSLTGKLLRDAGFSGLPATDGDRSSKSKSTPAYQSQGAGIHFDA